MKKLLLKISIFIFFSTGFLCTSTLQAQTEQFLISWGSNNKGQLGDGTTTSRLSPVQIGNAINWKSIAAGGNHTLSLKTDGSLWAWGNNVNCQLGNNSRTDSHVPVRIGSDTNWEMVAAGNNHSLGIKTDGTLWGWGLNNFGQVSGSSVERRFSPFQIGNDTNWKAVSGGDLHTVALKTDGTIWAWGLNNNGRLGDGTTTDRYAPVQIGSETDWKMVVAGPYHSMAIKTDGTLWVWGKNDYGQLGDGSTTDRHVPVRIGNDSDWSTVSAGGYNTMAIKTDGTLWAWGSNVNGRLGDGTTIDRLTPFRIGNASDWKDVKAGHYHTVTLKKDSTLWAWGENYGGRVGDGTSTNKDTPVLIGSATNWNSVTPGWSHTVALLAKKDLTFDAVTDADGNLAGGDHPIYAGHKALVKWTTNPYGNFSLSVSYDGGTSWAVEIPSVTGDSTDWIPQRSCDSCLIRVSYSNAEYGSDISDLFQVQTDLQIEGITDADGRPIGVDNLAYAGHKTYVKWIANALDDVNLSVSYDGGSSWSVEKTSIVADSVEWVPQRPCDSCQISVSYSNIEYGSDTSAYFQLGSDLHFSSITESDSTIIDTENKGFVGQEITLNWESELNSFNVLLSVDAGSSWSVIENGIMGYSYPWTPDSTCESCIIKIQNPEFQLETESEPFSITHDLNFNLPELLMLNEPNEGSWSSKYIQSVDLYYKHLYDPSWTFYATIGKWEVDSTEDGNYKLYTSPEGSTWEFQSHENGHQTWLFQSETGENWKTYESEDGGKSWLFYSPASDVPVLYSTEDAGWSQPWPSDANNFTYQPTEYTEVKGGLLKMVPSFASNLMATDTFTVGSLHITSFQNSEEVQVGKTETISWEAVYADTFDIFFDGEKIAEDIAGEKGAKENLDHAYRSFEWVVPDSAGPHTIKISHYKDESFSASTEIMITNPVPFTRFELYENVKADSTNLHNFIQPGEKLRLKVRVKNDFGSNLLTLKGYLTTNSPYITITDSVGTFNNILTGSQGWTVDEFEILLADTIPANAFASFSLRVEDEIVTEDPWTSRQAFEIPLTPFDFPQVVIDDDGNPDSKGDNDDVAEPGEDIELLPLLQNNTSATFYSVHGKLTTPASYVDIWHNKAGASGMVYDQYAYNVLDNVHSPIDPLASQIPPEEDFVFSYLDTTEYALPFDVIVSAYAHGEPGNAWDNGAVLMKWGVPFLMNEGKPIPIFVDVQYEADASFEPGEDIPVSISATSYFGKVDSVIIYVNGVKTLVQTAEPYDFVLNTEGLAVGDHTVSVEVYDQEGYSASGELTISLVGREGNTAPAIADQTFTLYSNAMNGSLLGTVEATDENGDPLTYAITSGNTGGAFDLDATTGELTVADISVVDFAATESFALTTEVTDGELSATATLTVNLSEEDRVTAIEDALKDAIVMYPNPAESYLILEIPQALLGSSLTIYSLIGDKLQEEKLQKSGQKIGISRLPAGAYILRIRKQDTDYSFKILKLK